MSLEFREFPNYFGSLFDSKQNQKEFFSCKRREGIKFPDQFCVSGFSFDMSQVLNTEFYFLWQKFFKTFFNPKIQGHYCQLSADSFVLAYWGLNKENIRLETFFHTLRYFEFAFYQFLNFDSLFVDEMENSKLSLFLGFSQPIIDRKFNIKMLPAHYSKDLNLSDNKSDLSIQNNIFSLELSGTFLDWKNNLDLDYQHPKLLQELLNRTTIYGQK